MPKPYDATTKWLIDLHPQDWLRLLGYAAAGAVEPLDVAFLDTDLATITAATDRVLKVRLPLELLLHIELETGHHGSQKPHDLLNYSVLLTRKYLLPVETAVIVLRRQADSPALTGALEYRRGDGSVYLRFEYNIVRVWELPVETLLAGGLGTLPLAPLANVELDRLPGIVRRMQERIDAEGGPDAPELWTATKILMGLRYSLELANSLLKGVRDMEESVTYQEILEKGEARGEVRGRVEGERQALLRVGARRLGPPSAELEAQIAAIESAEQIMDLLDRLLAVESWSELLAA